MENINTEPYIFNIYNDTKIVGIILIAIVVIFLVFVFILYLFGAFTFSPKPNPPPPIDNFPQLTWDVGASTGGQVNYNNGVNLNTESLCNARKASWNTGSNSCQCEVGFFGPNCNLPIFSHNYYAVGQDIINATVQPNIIKQATVNAVSFDPQHIDATSICDNTPGCIGFSLQGNQASFFSDLKVPNNGHIPYDITLPPIYYMKLNTEPSFPDRVFLTKGKIPLRYWNLDRFENPETNIISLLKDTVYELDFLPDPQIKNIGNLTGLLSDNTFKYTDIPNLIANPPSNMIKFNGSTLPTIPHNWTLPIYIAFH